MKRQHLLAITCILSSYAFSENLDVTVAPAEIVAKDNENKQDFKENLAAALDKVDYERIDESKDVLPSRPYQPLQTAEPCISAYRNTHIGIRANEARGIGYSEGYTTLEAFTIFDRFGPNCMPFVDLRAHVFNNGQWAANFGIGERSLLTSSGQIFGAYLYYDRRNDSHLNVNQLSTGIELLDERLEYRISGYFPVGKNKSRTYGYAFDTFQGNQIIIKANKKYAMTGFDAEIGAHATESTKYDLFAGIGPYYFTSSAQSAWGAKARVIGRYKDYISLEFTTTYDRIFHNTYQGSIAFNFPFGPRLKHTGKGCPHRGHLVFSRATIAPYRMEIPVIDRFKKKEVAINPSTNTPWSVFFVDNTSSSLGTFENPFPTLIQAQNASSVNDIIYVFPGDGTTTGMNHGITLKNFQKLFGSGLSHPLATTRGLITIFALSQTYPQITNSTSNAITLNNGNEIAGIRIPLTVSGTTGVGGTNVNDIIIDHNIFSGTVAHQVVHLTNCGGIISITNNQATTQNQSLGAITLHMRDNNTVATISNNTINGYLRGIFTSVITSSSSPTGMTEISGNTISDFSIFGIAVTSNSSTFITNNAIANTRGIAGSVSMVVTPSQAYPVPIVIDQNLVTKTTSSSPTFGILVLNANKPTIINNNLSTAGGLGSGYIGVYATSTNVPGSMCLTLHNNISLSDPVPSSFGYKIFSTGAGVINLEEPINDIGTFAPFTGTVNIIPVGSCQ